jgi:predicted RNase H-like nuclease
MSGVVMGVDGCSRGWVGVAVTGVGVKALFAPTISELAEAALDFGEVKVMAIDIPIGLPDAGGRKADVLARRSVGLRSSSVFSTPVRGAVEADIYEDAAQVQRRMGGSGLTRQAFGLRTKIREVDAWLPSAACRVVEVHPEVSFAELAREPLAHGKTTWAGAEQRRRLLERAMRVFLGAR